MLNVVAFFQLFLPKNQCSLLKYNKIYKILPNSLIHFFDKKKLGSFSCSYKVHKNDLPKL